MGTKSSYHASFILLLTLTLLLCLDSSFVAGSNVDKAKREVFEIIIDGGGSSPSPECQDCPPLPPPPIECPPPPPPPPIECSPPPPPPPIECSPPPPPPPIECPPPPPPPPIEYPPPPSPPIEYPPPPPPPIEYPPPPPPPIEYPPPPPPPIEYPPPPPPPIEYPPPPPPPIEYPPPPPPPPPPNDVLLDGMGDLIQNFGGRITSDPKHITDSWSGSDVCKYKGFYCENLPGTNTRAIAGVDFNGYLLAGPDFKLSGLLDELTYLAIFHANSNNFTGTVPKFVGKLPYLYELDLSNNKLSGEFPTEVLGAANLTFLDLRFNSFTGPVPPQIFNIDFDVFFINNNMFDSELPSNLGSSRAVYMTFANNNFTGSIPSSIGSAPYLLEVLFLNNKLTGCLPYEIGYLSHSTVFDVSSNYLTGPIPYSFGCLTNMRILNLARNKFYGMVPEIVCTLPKLSKLSLSYNYFTQIGPYCKHMIRKRRLDVRFNCILGLPNQRSPEECAAFFYEPIFCCSNKNFMNWIPCTKNGLSNIFSVADDGQQQSVISADVAPAPRTYAALVRP